MILLLCVLLGLVGWALLSLGLPKHHRALRGRDPAPAERRAWRSGGWLALLAMFAVCVAARGWEFGLVYAGVLMMLTALAWSLWLARLTVASEGRRCPAGSS